MHEDLALAFGERLDDQNLGLIRGLRGSRKLFTARRRGEQAPVAAGQFRVTAQYRPKPALLQPGTAA